MAYVDLCETAEDVKRNARAVQERRQSSYKSRPAEPAQTAEIAKWTPAVADFSYFGVPFPTMVRAAYPATYEIKLDRPTITDVQNAVCAAFGVSTTDLLSARRNLELSIARHVAVGLCRTFTLHSYPNMAKAFGNRDHTTIMHSVKVSAPFLAIVADRVSLDLGVVRWAREARRVVNDHPELRPYGRFIKR